MAGPTSESSRTPVFAGKFYPADEAECRQAAQDYIASADVGVGDARRWIGGIVPHAGWICSAAIAARTIAAVARGNKPDVVVIFGAVHTPLNTQVAALDDYHSWTMPAGEFEIAEELRGKLLENSELFATDRRFHEHEHAVEVELPLVRAVWPNVMVMPVEIPAIDVAVNVGRSAAVTVSRAGLNAVYLASSDLTHYGPNYRFTPGGVGLGGFRWAMDNDRRLLQLVTDMQPERIVPETRSRLNACGGGAIAAMMSACREAGGSNVRILQHSNSYEVLEKFRPQAPTDAVGYVSVVIG